MNFIHRLNFTFVVMTGLIIFVAHDFLQAKTFAYGTRFYQRYYGLTVGLDPYESYISVFCNLRTTPPPAIVAQSELEFYWLLFLRSFQPYYFLIQGTDYPLTHATSLFKHANPDLYHNLDWRLSDTDTINVLQVLASGYEEPYAISFFVGYLTPFWNNAAGQHKQIGSASSGFVFSFGNRHVRDLELINDNWYEVKWSLKGDQETKERFLKWNIQAGEKIHDNPSLLDAWFVRLYRDHLNRNYFNVFSLQNAGIECRAEMPIRNMASLDRIQDAFSLIYIDVNKKLPSRRWKQIVYTVDAGVSWEKYNDIIQAGKFIETLNFFVRPNILF
jgi:hypothetical protein